MGFYKRACLVAPDRWMGSVAQGLRQQFPTVEVVCVADEAANKLCLNLRAASSVAGSVAAGLRGCDLILIGQRDFSPEIGYQSIVKACQKDATIIGHNRSISEAGDLMRALNRNDVHYVGMEIRNASGEYESVSMTNAAALKQQVVALSPASVDDLDALFSFQECVQRMGARVVGMSPQIHDRALAKFVHLPKAILIPMVRYLLESEHGDKRVLMPDVVQILPALSGLNSETAAGWSSELSGNKKHLLAALEDYKRHIADLEKELSGDRMQNCMTMLLQQMAELSSVSTQASITAESDLPPVVSTTPESLISTVDSLLVAVDQLKASGAGTASGTGIHAIRKLVEQTHDELTRLYQQSTVEEAEVLTKTPVVEKPSNPAVAEAVVKAPPVRTMPTQPTAEPKREYKPEPVTVHVAPPTPVAAPEASHTETVEMQPAPVWKGPKAQVEAEPVVVEAPAQTKSIETEVWAPAEESMDAYGQEDSTYDLLVSDKPEVQARQRAQRLLAGARIPIRSLETFVGPEGTKVVGINLANPMQRDAARSLLRQAGIPLEYTA